MTPAIGLVVGAVLGMAGTFAPSAGVRALAWGVDGTALIVASALLSDTMPALVKSTGFVGAFLFAVVAVRIFLGADVTPLSKPLPYFAYPFLAATLLGWAWVTYRRGI